MFNDTTSRFILSHLLYGIISLIWYRVIFRCVSPDFSIVESYLALVITLVFVSFLFVTMQRDSHRNGISVTLNLIFGYGLYTAVSYSTVFPWFIQALCSLFGIWLMAFFCFIVWYYVNPSEKGRKRKLINRIEAFILSTQLIWGVIFAILIGFIAIRQVLNIGLIYSSPKTHATTNKEEDTEIPVFRESEWKKADLQKKMDMLQMIVDSECEYLGISHPVTLGCSTVSNKNLLASYDDSTQHIIMNVDYLLNDNDNGNFYLVCQTVLEEIYHAYEYSAYKAYLNASEYDKRLFLYRDAEIYGMELEDYDDGRADYYTYSTQLVEQDAKRWALERVDKYCLVE